MPKPRPWTVAPHDPIEKLEDNLWAVDGEVPGVPQLRRRMVMVRLGDGRLVFHNAVPLDEAAMKEMEAWGTPSLLVVPNGYHRLDVHAWKQRYPSLAVYCPKPAEARVRKMVPVDGAVEALPTDASLRVEALEGMKNGEAVLVVTSGARVSVVFGDVFHNSPPGTGFMGFMNRVMGFTGGPKVVPVQKLVLMRDREGVRKQLARLAELPGLARLIPSHGRIVGAEAGAVLARAAKEM